MTDSNKTLIAGVKDRSGSMISIAEDAAGGWNALIESQRQQPGELLVSSAQFDSTYELLYNLVPAAEVEPWVCHPRSNTAMLDAIGRFVTDLGEKLAAMPENERPGLVQLAIVTDGHENASHEWTWDAVSALLKQQREQYGWDIIYIGANQNAIEVGNRLGVDPGKALTYDTQNTSQAYDSMSNYVTRSRSFAASGQDVASNAFTEDERVASGLVLHPASGIGSPEPSR